MSKERLQAKAEQLKQSDEEGRVIGEALARLADILYPGEPARGDLNEVVYLKQDAAKGQLKPATIITIGTASAEDVRCFLEDPGRWVGEESLSNFEEARQEAYTVLLQRVAKLFAAAPGKR
jgi:hypothetical protein